MTANLFYALDPFGEMQVIKYKIYNNCECKPMSFYKYCCHLAVLRQITPISMSYPSFIYLLALNVDILVKPNSRKQFWILNNVFCVVFVILLVTDQTDGIYLVTASSSKKHETHMQNVGCQ